MIEIKAVMPAKVVSINVNIGDLVVAGQEIAFIEAMKMEMPVESTASGTVEKIFFSVGDNINTGDTLFLIK